MSTWDVGTTISTSALVLASAQGDESAWNALVQRYAPLVVAVIRRFRLSDRDVEDISQTVWLRLVEHLPAVREPEAVAGWLATTARNESLRQLRAKNRVHPVDPTVDGPLDGRVDSEADTRLLRAESHHALREGLRQLPPRDRQLLLLLVHDPPLSYLEISQRMSMPVGSIGPTRKRSLEKLRNTPAVSAYLNSATGVEDLEGGGRHAFVGLD